jgi:antitoxin (DNA-binding transcriptional repressor) of toxin-antitoxin stability system
VAIIHISEAEAAADFAALLARVRAGAEVVIESDTQPVAVLRLATEPRGRLLSESIALAEAHANELGYEPVMDAGFAADLEGIIRNRKAP